MIELFFGKPGVGKSTLLAKIAVQEQKKIDNNKSRYKYVLTNLPIKKDGIVSVRYEDLARYEFEKCLILLDEITLDADSRDFKKFTKEHKEFFILHRHYKNKIILFTQVYNRLDKTIRDIVDKCYYVKKFFGLSYYYRIPTSIIIPEETGEIQQGYIKPRRFEKMLGTKYIIRPFYYKYFNSFIKGTDRPKYNYAQNQFKSKIEALDKKDDKDKPTVKKGS